MSINKTVTQAHDMYQALVRPPQEFKISTAREFMKSSLKNPTQGMLAEHRAQKEFAGKYNDNFWHNTKVVDNDFVVQELNRSLTKKVTEKAYPKSYITRQYLVDKEHVVADQVKPNKKKGIIDRVNIFLRKLSVSASEINE